MIESIDRFLFRVLDYFHRKAKNRVVNNEARNNEEKWSALFGGKDSILFALNNKVKIKLLKANVLSRLIFDGFEENEIEFVTKALKKGDVFVDIGANIGLFSLIASPLVDSTGKVISFEPSPETFSRLIENVSLNNLTNISARNIGLSDSEGELMLNVSGDGHDAWNTFAAVSDEKFHSTKSVPVFTLDDQLVEEAKEKISLVKIDVEGWEKFVLVGGKTFFQKFAPVVMMEFTESNTFSAGYMVQELYDLMVSWGYRWYSYKNGELHPEAKRLHYPYDNLIATKDIEILRKRLG
ncbi:MAG: FkbM family methyltransferase [Bacteroidetes bacterium]|nr:FkbM family methyltransferase [Bacteroidota bacterium]